ncbi:hypothetical protein [uncultured Eubacterium sp.]|uniref:hypothetical protein n=1 Tax=uncultured Eubacterium sp. TaxID=165185 RepID=UPI0025D18C1B|nr:hypothetical protein [uncultured Eubacterium sp.]
MTQKDENDLLHEICRNSSMGVDAIHEVLKDIYDEEFAYELNVQADKMEQFGRKAGMRLRANGSEPAEPKPIATAMLKTSIKMRKTLQNKTEDVADMIGKGNERGVKELKHAIHKYRDAGIFATELAKEMVDFEEDNLRKMQTYQKDS